MNKILLLLCVLLLLLAPAGAQTSRTVYTCPMHPEVRRDRPGDCPKCGMTLERKTIRVQAPAPKPRPKPRPASGPPATRRPKPAAPDPHAGHAVPPAPAAAEDPEPDRANHPIEPAVRTATPPRTVRYDLYVKDTMVNYTGRRRHAIAINGSIPAPTLHFTEGDTAEIWVHNLMHHETSIHWHGLILPNTEDGVSYLTTAPILPHRSHRFYFPIVQSGTYWYHSHTMTQEQDGMYGAFIIHKRAEPNEHELPVVLSEWSDLPSMEIQRSLHNQTDWFGIRKDAAQSYAEAIRAGHFGTKLRNEWKRMLAMDVSDVYYDRFLINGTPEAEAPQYKAGDKLRLRVVNGGASTYFWLTWAGGRMTVVATDGEDVEPVEVDRLIIAVAETYDVIVTIPDEGHSYEFLATAEDRTKSASLWLGSGSKVIAPHLPRLKYFEGMKMMNGMMKMNGDLKGMEGMKMTNGVMDMNTVMYPEITGDAQGIVRYGNKVPAGSEEGPEDPGPGPEPVQEPGSGKADHGQHDHGGHPAHGMRPVTDNAAVETWSDMNSGPLGIKTLNYTMLRSPRPTNLPDWPTRTLFFELTGNMNRYVWSLNNRTVSETEVVKIRKGENIRIVMFNNTMMRHPMHLHGHFFRVINGQGDHSPLKNTLDMMPMETDTIEFAGTESGDWFFHCHILYHMMSGMGRIFSYENSPPNPQIPDVRKARRKLFQDDRKFYLRAEIGLESNGSDGEAVYANTRWQVATEWRLGIRSEFGYESETVVGRYLGRMQWWLPFIGFDYHYNSRKPGRDDAGYEAEYNLFGQESNQANRRTVIAGVRYTLPLLVIGEARIDGLGKARLQLMREDIPVSPRLRLNLMANTDKEYGAGLRYILTKYISLSTHYDSDMGLGAGIAITY